MGSDEESVKKAFVEYKQLANALRNVLKAHPNGNVFYDFSRIKKARLSAKRFRKGKSLSEEEAKSILTRVPEPYYVTEITYPEFHRLFKEYGNAVYLMTTIDANLRRWLRKSGEDEHILSTGGACVFDVVDMKIRERLDTIDSSKELSRKYCEKILSDGPTLSQITGAIIPKKGLNILYDETFPWDKRLKEYGITHPTFKAKHFYTSLERYVRNYTRMIHGDKADLVRIPFAQLQLENAGHLREWEKMYAPFRSRWKMYSTYQDNHPSFIYHTWVYYTYVGPGILSVVKTILAYLFSEQSYQKMGIEQYSIHVRGKQIDHLTYPRNYAWRSLSQFYVRSKKEEKHRKMYNRVVHQINVAIHEWFFHHYQENRQLGFIGRIDQNQNGVFLHEDRVESLRMIQKKSKDLLSLPEIFASSRIVQHQLSNVVDVILSMTSKTNENSTSMSSLLSDHQIYERYLTKQPAYEKDRVINLHLLSVCELLRQNNFITINTNKWNTILNQTNNYGELMKDLLVCLSDDRSIVFYHLFRQNDVDQYIERVLGKKRISIPNIKDKMSVAERNQHIETLICFLQKEDKRYRRLLTQNKARMEKITRNIHSKERILTIANETATSSLFTSDILPIANNLFFSMAQLFLFDQKMRRIFIKAAMIESSKEYSYHEKESAVSHLIKENLSYLLMLIETLFDHSEDFSTISSKHNYLTN